MKEYLRRIAQTRPVVQCITNIVTVNDCANALLAIGASATMAHHPREMEDFARFCDALVCNMGATENLEAMEIAGKLASERNHPVVIDPVGCAGSRFRRERCLHLIRSVHPSCIRGNAAEIRALAEDRNTGRGVDVSAGAEPQAVRGEEPGIRETVTKLAKQTGAIVVASGAVDVIGENERILELCGGSPLMARITGSGCMLSSMIGAFLAVENSVSSAAAACEYMNRCAESAQEQARDKGTGTFHIALLDALYAGTV